VFFKFNFLSFSVLSMVSVIHLLLVMMHVSCARKVVLVLVPVVDTFALDRGVR